MHGKSRTRQGAGPQAHACGSVLQRASSHRRGGCTKRGRKSLVAHTLSVPRRDSSRRLEALQPQTTKQTQSLRTLVRSTASNDETVKCPRWAMNQKPRIWRATPVHSGARKPRQSGGEVCGSQIGEKTSAGLSRQMIPYRFSFLRRFVIRALFQRESSTTREFRPLGPA